jgi:hypothetical protein
MARLDTRSNGLRGRLHWASFPCSMTCVEVSALDIERCPVVLVASAGVRIFRDGNVPIALAAIEGVCHPLDESL